MKNPPRPEHRRAFDKAKVCPTEVHEAMKADPEVWNRLELLARHEGLEYRHCDKCPSTLCKFENEEDDYESNPSDYEPSKCQCGCKCKRFGNVQETGLCRDCFEGDCPGDEKERRDEQDDYEDNPGEPDPEPPQLSSAVGKFEEFHKHPAKGFGPFAPNLKIPDTIGFVGEAVYVAYNSNKWGDKASYIHHHDCGNCGHEREDHYDDEPYPCEKWGCNCKRFRSNVKFFMPSGGNKVAVPSFIKSARTLTRLGKCLEFCYIGGDGLFKEHKSGSGFELFCIPSGKALLIIADKSRLVAMVWGGKLNVKDVGIVG